MSSLVVDPLFPRDDRFASLFFFETLPFDETSLLLFLGALFIEPGICDGFRRRVCSLTEWLTEEDELVEAEAERVVLVEDDGVDRWD